MISSLTRRIRRWRMVELFILFLLVGVSAGTVYGLINNLVTEQYLWLFATAFAALLITWVVVSSMIAGLLRSLANQATVQTVRAFDSLYERSPVAYLTVTKRGKIRRANPAATHLLGDTIDMIGTRNFYDFIRIDDADTGPAMLQAKVTAGMTVSDLELPIETLTGQQLWVLVNVFAGDHPDERLIAITDMTEERAVDTAKSEFVALATHQLRTPIAAIRWNVELLERTLREVRTEKQQAYLTKIERNVMRMLSLINDFLSVSKLEMGTYAAESEVVEFGEYLQGILDEFEEKILNKQLHVTHALEPETLRVALDRRLFHIILSNLLSNAVKYTPSGGTIEITANGTSAGLTLRIADSGMGIPEHEQAELFTKFFRASNAKSAETQGTGLGLYVVKQSVEILGGTLAVHSVEGQGTAFTITLPNVVR